MASKATISRPSADPMTMLAMTLGDAIDLSVTEGLDVCVWTAFVGMAGAVTVTVAKVLVTSAVGGAVEDVGCAVGAVVDVSVRASEFQVFDEGATGLGS